MKPIRLRARNLRTFPDLDLTFAEGLVGILGELRDGPDGASSNGAGKSTILEAVDIALFGRRSLAGYLTRGGDVDELMVELTFEHEDNVYRIRRTYSARGRGKTSVDLELAFAGVDERWAPLTCSSTKETDAFLCDLLGLSKETFRDSAYLRQGDGGYADPDRDPRQRKELLVEAVLGRDPIWPKLAEHARTRRKEAQARLERLAGETEAARDLASTATAVEYETSEASTAVERAAAAVADAEARLAAISTRYQAAREQAAARQALEAELRAAEQTVKQLEERETAATEAARAIDVARDELETLATQGTLDELVGRETMLDALLDSFRQATIEHEQARRDHEAAFLRRNDLLGQANELNERAHALRVQADDVLEHVGTARCTVCEQTLGEEAAQRAAASYRAEADSLDATARRLDEEAKGIALPSVPEKPPEPPQLEGDTAINHLIVTRTAIARARDELAQRARLEERIARLQETVTARPATDHLNEQRAAAATKRQALDDLEPVNLRAIEAEGGAVRLAVEDARRAHETAIAAKARLDERLTQVRAAEQKLADLAETISSLHGQVDRDLLLEKAYGRDGIPALIIENTAIPYLETEASRILNRLGTSFQVELRTQAENKTGGLRDTLQVVVIDQDGNEADYADGCSGGEQTRIGLALRIALARLLAHRRGADSRLLALDEPSYLDQAGMAVLLDVLRDLEPEFDLILLVSHVTELRDALDEVITVVKEAGRSRIAGIPVPEAAAA